MLQPAGFVDLSVTGFIIVLARASWQSRQQPSVALSSFESEDMAACASTQEALWLIQLLKEFNRQFFKPVVLFDDNKT